MQLESHRGCSSFQSSELLTGCRGHSPREIPVCATRLARELLGAHGIQTNAALDNQDARSRSRSQIPRSRERQLVLKELMPPKIRCWSAGVAPLRGAPQEGPLAASIIITSSSDVQPLIRDGELRRECRLSIYGEPPYRRKRREEQEEAENDNTGTVREDEPHQEPPQREKQIRCHQLPYSKQQKASCCPPCGDCGNRIGGGIFLERALRCSTGRTFRGSKPKHRTSSPRVQAGQQSVRSVPDMPLCLTLPLGLVSPHQVIDIGAGGPFPVYSGKGKQSYVSCKTQLRVEGFDSSPPAHLS
ncbi:hypothetical protein cyc_07481 [Cyclospora cayetanensis]|uniref:Uncharacterized protein n=1 Tax=Cyclospora cayetanensis TaxID=88456 RepID=A0A1D3DAW0_9EIME|nr:hypothetical protein cyc_07481 [Cyclospora cayetanensis]